MNIKVLGAYRPSLTPERMAEWICSDVAAFGVEIRELRLRGLAQYWTEEKLLQREAELPREMAEALNSAVLLELLVEGHGGTFDPDQFFEEQTSSVAWEPAYLSTTGDEIAAKTLSDLSTEDAFRVAFYVHDWPEHGVLVGPMGKLALPSFAPVPERLWKLAPYVLLD